MSTTEKRRKKPTKHSGRESKKTRNEQQINLRDYNKYFLNNNNNNRNISSSSSANNSTSSKDSNDSINQIEEISELIELVSKMSITINFLTEKLNKLNEELDKIKNNSTLSIRKDDVNEEDLPHLAKFEAFKLPIEDQAQLEALENSLEQDKSFAVFFVSSSLDYIYN